MDDVVVGGGGGEDAGVPLLLKVDAEGHELHALRGVNLDLFPFRFLTFEFFPELLSGAGGTDPLELPRFNSSSGCVAPPSRPWPWWGRTAAVAAPASAAPMDTEDDFRSWYEDHVAPSHAAADPGYHANLFFQRKETNAGGGG